MKTEANNEAKAQKPQRTEELQYIIDRMPTKSSKWITLLVIFLLSLILIFGWVVRYHDVIAGSITISQFNAPVKMVANSHGKISLLFKDEDNIEDGDYIAYIQSSTNIADLRKLISLLDSVDVEEEDQLAAVRLKLLRTKFSLGELNLKYYHFLNSLSNLLNYNIDDVYEKQGKTIAQLLDEYEKMNQSIRARTTYNRQNADIIRKFHKRDSILLEKKVISQAEYDKSQLNYIESQAGKENFSYQLSELSQQIKSTKSRMELLGIERKEKYLELKIELAAAYAELENNIKTWEERYVLKSPVKGKIQFLKFWNENHFVQEGEPLFIIIPKNKKLYGQLNLPNIGSGKVKHGQEVIIKLDDFPYMEYGSIKGKVKGISLGTNTQQTQTGAVENYMVNVELPSELITNYNIKLNGKNEVKGTGEIITSNRRLIHRIFDNLKYLLKN